MLTLTQIRRAEEILAMTDYYTLSIAADQGEPELSRIRSVSVLKISDRQVVREAFLPMQAAAPEEGSDVTYSAESVAKGLAKLLKGAAVAAEPDCLQYLRIILEQAGFDGEIRFLPVCRLASAVFPDSAGETCEAVAAALHLPDPQAQAELYSVYREAMVLEACRLALSGKSRNRISRSVLIRPPVDDSDSESPQFKGKARIPVSDEALGRLAKSAWSASPWVFAALAIAMVLLAVILVPKVQDNTVDRNVAPVNYLVLSWDQTGKYGTQPNTRSPIQFRLPYGVYDVLNNNSIPVEVHVISEGEAAEKALKDYAAAKELGSVAEDDQSDPLDNKVTLRPNSKREITIDTDQYLTLSEEATNLIFFYVSAVPDEPESDTTGQVYAGNVVVYAYVKGTEVRFRRAPSLEGQIIDTLNNGQQVQVLAISGEWTHVQVQDQKGYIFSQYLDTTDPNKRDVTPESQESGQFQENSTDTSDTGQPSIEDASNAQDAADPESTQPAATEAETDG